jgi:uncharacterized protein (DUF433 family)
MVSTGTKYIGRGAYSVVDAARIVGRHYNTIRRWLDPSDGIIRRAYDPSVHTISFAELMELHFIKMFEAEGVSFQTIRRAARAAEKLYVTDYPFTVKRFDTDGRTIFATLAGETKKKEVVEDLKRGQYVFSTIMRPFFRKLDYDRTDISRYWPMTKRGRVVLDPARSFGQPIDSKTGIPTKALYNAVNADRGQSIKQVAKWFGVPESAVRSAVEFEKSLS